MTYLVEIPGDDLRDILELLKVVGLVRPHELVNCDGRKVADGHLAKKIGKR